MKKILILIALLFTVGCNLEPQVNYQEAAFYRQFKGQNMIGVQIYDLAKCLKYKVITKEYFVDCLMFLSWDKNALHKAYSNPFDLYRDLTLTEVTILNCLNYDQKAVFFKQLAYLLPIEWRGGELWKYLIKMDRESSWIIKPLFQWSYWD